MDERLHTLTFAEPVTFRVLRQACAVAGVDIDDVLDDPVGTLDGFTLPLARAQAFLDIVLVGGPRLDDLLVAEAEAMAALVCANFFSHLCGERWQQQAETLRSFMTASAGRRQAATQA